MKITEFNCHHKKYFPAARGCGPRPLVEKLIDNIMKIDATIEVTQVKEKFGYLRFYINGGNDLIYDLLMKVKQESSKICERCGTHCVINAEKKRKNKND